MEIIVKYGTAFALAIAVLAVQAEVLKITNETNVPMKVYISGSGMLYKPVLNSQGGSYVTIDLPLADTMITIVAEQLGQNIQLSGHFVLDSKGLLWVMRANKLPDTLKSVAKASEGTTSVEQQVKRTGTDWRIVLNADDELKIRKASQEVAPS